MRKDQLGLVRPKKREKGAGRINEENITLHIQTPLNHKLLVNLRSEDFKFACTAASIMEIGSEMRNLSLVGKAAAINVVLVDKLHMYQKRRLKGLIGMFGSYKLSRAAWI